MINHIKQNPSISSTESEFENTYESSSESTELISESIINKSEIFPSSESSSNTNVIGSIEYSDNEVGSNSKLIIFPNINTEITNSNSEINKSIFESSEIISSENESANIKSDLEELQKPESTIFNMDKSYAKEYSTEIISDTSEKIRN